MNAGASGGVVNEKERERSLGVRGGPGPDQVRP